MRRLGGALSACLLASAAVAQDVPPDGSGPRGTSGEVHDDLVGYATIIRADAAQPAQLSVSHPSLPLGSFVEVTALATGRIIVALVTAPYHGDGIVGLSSGAADALGIGSHAPVRVRAVMPGAQDQAALRLGRAPDARLDAPPALLAALRRKLPSKTVVTETRRSAKTVGRALPAADAARPPSTTQPPAAGTAHVAARGAYGVQVATLSSADRAAELARRLDGHFVGAGGLFRVQLGPFADSAAAARARDAAARAGYGDAHLFRSQ